MFLQHPLGIHVLLNPTVVLLDSSMKANNNDKQLKQEKENEFC